MNKLLTIFLAGIIAFSFTSCKKGEEDPFLSFSSRDSRLIGEWELQSGSQVVTNTIKNVTSAGGESVYTITTTSTYGSNPLRTKVVDNNGVTDQTEEAFTFTLSASIGEDGSYSYNSEGETYTSFGFRPLSREGGGNWFWANDKKNKAGIVFATVDTTNILGGEFKLIGLSGKEMKLQQNISEAYQLGDGTGGYTRKDIDIVTEYMMTKK